MIEAYHFLGRFNLHELFPYKICIHTVNDKFSIIYLSIYKIMLYFY